MSQNRQLILVIHNVRSSHNVGAMLRTCDGLGVKRVYLTGYTPYPQAIYETRLPYQAKRIDSQIHKTALGAEKQVNWQHCYDIETVLEELRRQRFLICALEQTEQAKVLPDFTPPDKLAIIVGREVEGIEAEVLKLVDTAIEIPMIGSKESLNVSVAAAIALYHCRYLSSQA